MIDEPDHRETEPAPADSPDSAPLEHVVDDLEPKVAWRDWAADEMTKGRPPEELTVELTENGWSEDDAAELVENARRSTRHLRGIITRDEVARENAARYHKATALSWFTAAISIASAWRLLNSLAFLFSSRRRRPLAPGFPVAPVGGAEPEPQQDASTAKSNESSA